MKCDELKVYKVYTTRNEGAFGFCEGSDPTDIELEHESVCLKSDVDKFIAELKEKFHDVDNQWNEQCKEIAQLKSENERLKAKLETVQASTYADSVDAGMRERRLKRALWLARAERAKEKQQLFLFSLGYEKLCIDGFYDPYSGRRELSPKQWVKAFNKVEIKCLKKAEDYK